MKIRYFEYTVIVGVPLEGKTDLQARLRADEILKGHPLVEDGESRDGTQLINTEDEEVDK